MPNGDLIVKNQGWLEEAFGPDVNIEWSLFASGGDVNEAVIAGAVDIGLVGSSPASRGLSTGIEYTVPWIFDVIGAAESLVATPDITTIADLEGKTVATPFASTAHFSLLAALDDAGVDASTVNIIDAAPDDIYAAWTRGDIDAAYVWNPNLAKLIAEGGNVLITSADLAAKGKTTYDLAIVSNAFADEYPDAVNVWAAQQDRAVQLINDDPDAAAEAVALELEITPEEAAAQLGRPRVPDRGRAGRPRLPRWRVGDESVRRRAVQQGPGNDRHRAGRIGVRGGSRRLLRRQRSAVSDASLGTNSAALPAAVSTDGGGHALRIRRVSHEYETSGGPLAVLDDIDIDVAAGTFLCLVGPSGCGKTTLLQLIAGFAAPSAGTIEVGGRPVTGPGADRGVVFQQPTSLMPWLSVRKNVELGPRCAACHARSAAPGRTRNSNGSDWRSSPTVPSTNCPVACNSDARSPASSPTTRT